MFVYVGTYTRKEQYVDGKGEGIYGYRMEPASGALTYVTTFTDTINPSFIAVHPSGRYLYAVNEQYEDLGPAGAVSAFAIDSKTRELTFLNKRSSHGLGPCYVSVDHTGQYVLVANYLTGNVSVYPIEADGRLGDATDIVQHTGSGPHWHQDGPHAHFIMPDPTNAHIIAIDKGADKLIVYSLDLKQGILTAVDGSCHRVAPGTGPRHLDFHPSGRYAYCINELSSTITAFRYDGELGRLTPIEVVPTLPDGFEGTNLSAAIQVAPSGKFVYGSNRGHDSIVIYQIDADTGKLTYVGHEKTQGATPRSFAIDPSGTLLLVANQDTDSVVAFHIDQETGKLLPTGRVTEVPTPACINIVRESV